MLTQPWKSTICNSDFKAILKSPAIWKMNFRLPGFYTETSSNMKYYFLEQIPEEIGQVEETDNRGYDRWGPNGYTLIPLEGQVPPGVYLPPCFLAERSQPTDFINVVAFGYKFLTISPRVLKLLGNFDVDYHSMLDTMVINQRLNIQYPYYGLHFPWFRNELYIDWEKTIFTIKEGFIAIGEIQFENYIEYRQWRNENSVIGSLKSKSPSLKKLFLKTDFSMKDIFMLNDISRVYIVSEQLKAAFEMHGITGMGFREVAG